MTIYEVTQFCPISNWRGIVDRYFRGHQECCVRAGGENLREVKIGSSLEGARSAHTPFPWVVKTLSFVANLTFSVVVSDSVKESKSGVSASIRPTPPRDLATPDDPSSAIVAQLPLTPTNVLFWSPQNCGNEPRCLVGLRVMAIHKDVKHLTREFADWS